MDAAPSRHSVHQVPSTIGWMMMKVMETTPRGTIMMPNSITSQGMVRQRRVASTMPTRISSVWRARQPSISSARREPSSA